MRIVVVEDEIKTLLGIVNLIASMEQDFEVVGTARNGKEGIDRILELKPDLTITDITMPEMGGLDMIRQIQAQLFECKYIILSGFAQFQFAQQAIKLGSIDYLLKPITKEALEFSLLQAKEMIWEEARLISPSKFTSKELLYRILNSTESDEKELMDELKNRVGEDVPYELLVVKAEKRIAISEQEKFEAAASYYLSPFILMTCGFEGDKEQYYLMKTEREVDLKQALQNLLKRWKEDVHIPVICSLVLVNSLSLLKRSAILAVQQCGWNLSLKEPVILTESVTQSFFIKKLVYPEAIEKAILKLIYAGEFELVEAELFHFTEYIHNGIYHYEEIREAMLCLTVAVLYSVRQKSYGIYEEISHLNLLDWIKDLVFLEPFSQMLLNVLKEFDCYQKKVSRCDHPVVNQVLQIIDKELSKDITVDSMARRMNLTPEYFSSLFTKELGIKYTAYCTQKRMEAAKALLSDPHIKMYEAAQACGYTDERYFSKVFKKYVGMSPGEYSHTNATKD